MQYAHLGRTGVVVSRLCLGTMNFGTQTSEKDSFAIMDKALDDGINFFDCANVYGIPERQGLSEEIIGNWLSQDSRRRDQIVLATKVHCPMGHGVNERGLSAYHIRQACEDSLRRLKTDRIDVYFMHHADGGEATAAGKQNFNLPERDLYHPPHRKRSTPWEEVLQALELLVHQGKVLYVASSNFAAWNIAQICEKSLARNFLPPVCEQSVYNLNNRTIELEVIPACREYGLGLVPWSPLGGGLLAGVLEKAESGRRADLDEVVEKYRTQLEAYEALCIELGEKPADVALAWLLKNPVVTSPIVGPRTMEQITGSLRALEIKLDQPTLTRLDEIWPGPGGEAPQAYAW
ncbi:MAG: aldo/keto reductase [Chloroflexi bacterium]|nr:aldo/keto reductase [Chloroflexota bacterium]